MKRKPRAGEFTLEQKRIYDRIVADPASFEGEVPPAVLRALEREFRPLATRPSIGGVTVSKLTEPPSPLMTGLDAASFLGLNLNAFARRVEPHLVPASSRPHRLYRLSELIAWRDAQEGRT
jgi:hypothetical protein